MPPYPQIHKCQNNKYRIGNGSCKFETKQAAINAFEHWIKNKKNCDFETWFNDLSLAEQNEFAGRGRNNGPLAAGPDGECVCPKCGATKAHSTGTPCSDMTCPKCGTKMTRRG